VLSGAILGPVAESCSSTTQPDVPLLRVEPTQTQYAPNDDVILTARNLSSADVSIGTCGSRLEHLVAGDWNDDGRPSPNCGDVGVTIHPGASVDGYAGTLPDTLSAGTYRFRIRVIRVPSDVFIASSTPSAPFLVRRGSAL
jgi:hypothetical protein